MVGIGSDEFHSLQVLFTRQRSIQTLAILDFVPELQPYAEFIITAGRTSDRIVRRGHMYTHLPMIYADIMCCINVLKRHLLLYLICHAAASGRRARSVVCT